MHEGNGERQNNLLTQSKVRYMEEGMQKQTCKQTRIAASPMRRNINYDSRSSQSGDNFRRNNVSFGHRQKRARNINKAKLSLWQHSISA